MKNIRVYFFLLCTLCAANCKKAKKSQINSTIIEQGKIPNKIIDHYLIAISLPVIQNGVKGVELRKWSPFNNSDSFPVSLSRVYLNDSLLKGEFYLFSDTDTGLITTMNELPQMKVLKYGPIILPNNIKDSIVQSNWFKNMNSINIDSIGLNKENIYFIGNVNHMLFERSDSGSYNAIFISDPEACPGLDFRIDRLADLSKFMIQVFIESDPNFPNWLEKHVKNIISKQ